MAHAIYKHFIDVVKTFPNTPVRRKDYYLFSFRHGERELSREKNSNNH